MGGVGAFVTLIANIFQIFIFVNQNLTFVDILTDYRRG